MIQNWNAVVTVFQGGFKRAVRALRELGRIERSPYHNVLVMTVDNPLDVQSRGVVGRVDAKAAGVFRPDFADVFVRG